MKLSHRPLCIADGMVAWATLIATLTVWVVLAVVAAPASGAVGAWDGQRAACDAFVEEAGPGGARLACVHNVKPRGCGGAAHGDRVEWSDGCRVEQGGMRDRWRMLLGIPMDLNRVGTADLQRIDGIGPVTARSILRMRDERGGFTDLSALLDVKGVGPARHALLSRHLYVAGAGRGAP